MCLNALKWLRVKAVSVLCVMPLSMQRSSIVSAWVVWVKTTLWKWPMDSFTVCLMKLRKNIQALKMIITLLISARLSWRRILSVLMWLWQRIYTAILFQMLQQRLWARWVWQALPMWGKRWRCLKRFMGRRQTLQGKTSPIHRGC